MIEVNFFKSTFFPGCPIITSFILKCGTINHFYFAFHCDFKSWKLLTCVYGELLLVVLNVDNKKKSYLKYKKFILNYKKPKLILIPPNYANAYLCLSKEGVLHYKWSYRGKYIDSKQQSSFRWNDPKFKIKWPIKKPILSNRDKNSKFL